MVCIVAFIVVLVLSAVSAKYRKLLGKAWGCFARRVTFHACDTTFRDDIKSSMLAPLAVRAPRLVKPASIAIEVLAWIMVLSLVVSLSLVGRSGLNLFVYGTCDKQDAQACSLAAQMCSIDGGETGFWESVGQGDVLGAFGGEFASLGETIAAVPSRLKTWDAAEYATTDATYLGGYVSGRPTALEVLDPGCRFCAELFRNMEQVGFDTSHNLTYLVYPIKSELGYKFPNSPLVASYLTAVRMLEADRGGSHGVTADWFVLEQLFTTHAGSQSMQEWMNDASAEQAAEKLQGWLAEAGLTVEEIAAVVTLAESSDVADALERTRTVVEDEIRTLAIPSLIGGGRLHSGLADLDTLRGLD